MTSTLFTFVPEAQRFPQKRARFLFKERRERALQTDLQLTASQSHGVISQQRYQEITGNKVTAALAGTDNFLRVENGDFIISLRTFEGGIELAKEAGCISPAYTVMKPSAEVVPSYFRYLLKSTAFISSLQTTVTGIRDGKSVKFQNFSNLVLPVPDLATQKAIADFLDVETARIDQLIERKERQDELLENKLDRTVLALVSGESDYPGEGQQRTSGISYLPKVPSHWSVEKIGWRYEIQLGKMLDSSKQTGENLKRYLRVADVQWGKINLNDLPTMDFTPADRRRFRLRKGDLLVNEGGSYVGRSAIWRSETEEVYYQKALHRVRPRNPSRDSSEFLYYLMRFATKFGVFVAGGNQTTIDHLTAEAFSRYRFAFPTLDEQIAIAGRLNAAETSFETLSTKINASNDRLKEFRAALITAAVTGQIDVNTYGKSGATDRTLDRIEDEMSA